MVLPNDISSLGEEILFQHFNIFCGISAYFSQTFGWLRDLSQLSNLISYSWPVLPASGLVVGSGYNSAISACASEGEWQQVMCLLECMQIRCSPLMRRFFELWGSCRYEGEWFWANFMEGMKGSSPRNAANTSPPRKTSLRTAAAQRHFIQFLGWFFKSTSRRLKIFPSTPFRVPIL